MESWVSLFTPSSGSAVRDMDVVGDHCVLTVRTPANELVLIVIPLTHPEKAHTVPVSVSGNSLYFTLPYNLITHLLYCHVSTLVPQLPTWACAIETKRPGLADQCKVLELLISSPVHPPVPYCLYPEDGLLLPVTEDGSVRENKDDYATARLEACSQVRRHMHTHTDTVSAGR